MLIAPLDVTDATMFGKFALKISPTNVVAGIALPEPEIVIV